MYMFKNSHSGHKWNLVPFWLYTLFHPRGDTGKRFTLFTQLTILAVKHN